MAPTNSQTRAAAGAHSKMADAALYTLRLRRRWLPLIRNPESGPGRCDWTARVSLVSVLDERASTFLCWGVRGQPLYCLPPRHSSRRLRTAVNPSAAAPAPRLAPDSMLLLRTRTRTGRCCGATNPRGAAAATQAAEARQQTKYRT